MTSNALIAFEQQLKPLAQPLAEVLADRMPVERLTRTLLISCERNPKLLECDRQSLINAAMSAAVLGLEVDGVTGQAYLIPFKGKAQLVVGYKGYNTMGARSAYTVTGACVREGDLFQYELGSAPFLKHKPLANTGRITHAWAVASSRTLPPIISVLSIDEVMAIKAKSPGARMSDSPWNDPAIGFPAMAEKSAKRRLARSMPLNVYQYAARLEEAFEEQGRAGFIDPVRGVQIEGELVDAVPSPTPSKDEILGTADVVAPREPDPPAPADDVPPRPTPAVASLEDEARAEAKKGEKAFLEWHKSKPRSAADKARMANIGEELRNLMNEHDLGPTP